VSRVRSENGTYEVKVARSDAHEVLLKQKLYIVVLQRSLLKYNVQTMYFTHFNSIHEKIYQFWLAKSKSSAIVSKYSAKKIITVQIS
jgi:hypothetical protein